LRQLFSSLWVDINGPGSWDANPWVWVVGFKVGETVALQTELAAARLQHFVRGSGV
jgi:hypothetical protein